MAGPCGWVVDWAHAVCAQSVADATPENIAAAEELAALTLWSLTGRVFGVCAATTRPCWQPDNQRTTYRGHSGLTYWSGRLVPPNTAGCGCSAQCTGPSEVSLRGPVDAVTAVWVDGAELASTAYKTRDRRWLVRVDGGVWPTAQNLAADDRDAGAFTVHYQRGIPVPAVGQVALGDLACEFLKARAGSGKCALPERAKSVARQGINVEMFDAAVLFEQGLTGVETVDRWIAAVNPHKRRGRARVYSVDAPRSVRMR